MSITNTYTGVNLAVLIKSVGFNTLIFVPTLVNQSPFMNLIHFIEGDFGRDESRNRD